MDTHEKPGLSPGTPGLRRRVVFELTVDELPLLAQAEERHGSKRAGLIAALRAEPQASKLKTRVAELEVAEAKAARKTAQERGREEKATASLRKELAATKARLAKRERELTDLRQAHQAAVGESGAEARRLEQLLEQREDELEELEERAVDSIYCGRCGRWAAVGEWAWRRIEGGGSYAYHRPCGEHAPGILGGSSWLARRG